MKPVHHHTPTPRFPRRLVALFAAAGGIAVANLYYAQPLLPAMAATWGLSAQAIASTVTFAQVGYALGLLFIVPLGDRFERRRLIVTMLGIVSVALFGVAVSPSPGGLMIASFIMGVATITPQLLLPLAAALAPPHDRGRVVGTVVSGIITGILVARTASGAIAALFGWRLVYVFAGVLSLLLAALLARALPVSPPPDRHATYTELLRSLGRLVREEPVLRRSAFFSAMTFGSFSAFWTVMPFLLQRPPYSYGTATIGLFGLLGASGTLVAPISGRLADRGHTRAIIFWGLATALAGYLLLMADPYRLASFIGAMILFDLGTIATQTANQSRVYALRPEARNRVNTVYMVTFFIAGSLGSFGGALGWTYGGWTGCCLVAAGFIAAGLALFAATELRPRAVEIHSQS